MAAFDRRCFLAALGAGALAPGLARAQPAFPDTDGFPRLDYGIVLSGGGAKGAYEAGIIDSLASGIPDGKPLHPYGGVAGTSIGALNGWFVSTGNYSAMRRLWMNVANEGVFRLKPQYAKITDPNAGIGTRLFELLQLGFGVRKRVEGLCQTAPALEWVQRYVDPQAPALLPFAWAVTNLTAQRSEYFYRLPAGITQSAREAVLRAFTSTLDPTTVVREATNDLLHRAIFASACLPVVFDPIELPAADTGEMQQYCDGGVAANTPLAFARTVAHNVHVVLLTPPTPHEIYGNAFEIGWAAYDTMQRHIFYTAIRSTYYETQAKRKIAELPRSVLDRFPDVRHFVDDIADATVAFLRPGKELPVTTTTFDDGEKIARAYRMGMQDATTGFKPYDPAIIL